MVIKKEQDADDAAEQRAEEHLPEIHVQTEDVDGGQGEYSASNHDAGACSDTLDDDVLAEATLLPEGAGHADCDDCDGDGGLEDLADLKAEICGRR